MAIEVVQGEIYCRHMDIVKKLKGQKDAFKDGFPKAFRAYQPIQPDEDWDVHLIIDKPFAVREELEDMVRGLL